MFKSVLALGVLAALTGVASADQSYTDAQLKVVSPRISEQIVSGFRPYEGQAVDTFTTRSLSNETGTTGGVASPRSTDQIVSSDR